MILLTGSAALHLEINNDNNNNGNNNNNANIYRGRPQSLESAFHEGPLIDCQRVWTLKRFQ